MDDLTPLPLTHFLIKSEPTQRDVLRLYSYFKEVETYQKPAIHSSVVEALFRAHGKSSDADDVKSSRQLERDVENLWTYTRRLNQRITKSRELYLTIWLNDVEKPFKISVSPGAPGVKKKTNQKWKDDIEFTWPTFAVSSTQEAHQIIGIDIHAKDYAFPPSRLPKYFDVLQYVESHAAKTSTGQRIAVNVHNASVSAVEEVRRHWLALGSGFEHDLTKAEKQVRQIEAMVRRYGALRNIINAHKGRPSPKILSFRDRLDRVFFPMIINPSDPPVKARMKVSDQFRGDELDANICPRVLTVPDFNEILWSKEEASSWLFPSLETTDELIPTVADFKEEDGEGVKTEREPSLENTLPLPCLDKSTQANLCPCPPLLNSTFKHENCDN